MIMETYRNQPFKTIFSIAFLILGLVTVGWYQELEVITLEAVINLITNEGMTSEVYTTLILNAVTSLGLLFIAILWIKSAIKPNYYETELINRGLNIITGLLLIAFSLIFIVYLFKKLTGFIIVLAILLLIAFAQDDKNKR